MRIRLIRITIFLMENSFLTRTVPRAGVCLAIGALSSYGLETLFDDIGPPASQQIADVEKCADLLGNIPTISQIDPPVCANNLGANQNFFSYTKDNRTYYLLPSAQMVRSYEQSITPSVNENRKSSKRVAVFGGALIGVALFASTAALSMQRRREKLANEIPNDAVSDPLSTSNN